MGRPPPGLGRLADRVARVAFRAGRRRPRRTLRPRWPRRRSGARRPLLWPGGAADRVARVAFRTGRTRWGAALRPRWPRRRSGARRPLLWPGGAADRVAHDPLRAGSRWRRALHRTPEGAECRGRRAVELDRRPGVGMAEAESRSVKAQAAERIPARAVAAVADDRVAELRQLDADLMAPARPELERHPGHVRSPLDHAVPGDRDARAPALGRRPARIGGPDAQRALLHEDVAERSLVRRHHALDDRDIPPLRGAREELRLEVLLRLRRLGDDQEPRGLPIQPVDDERPARGARSLEVGPHHAVGRALPLVLGPDREEPRRLLDDEERLVLVDQAQRRGEGGRRRRAERDRIGRGHGRARIANDLTLHAHPAGHEPGAQTPARRVGELVAEAGQDGRRWRIHGDDGEGSTLGSDFYF